MAFSSCNLSVLAYANNFTLWHYNAGNEYSLVAGVQDYFGNARDIVSGGDIVMVTGEGGGSIVFIKSFDEQASRTC